MTNQTIQLQSVGHVPAIQASEVREGDVRMFNFGLTSLIIKVIEKTAKTLSLITYSDGKYYITDIRKTSLVAIVEHDQDVSEHRPTQAWYKRDGMIDVSEYFPTIEQVEERQLEQYHLELQEKGMKLSATNPDVNENYTYKVVVSVDRDTDQVGEFEKVLTGKELDFQLFMNEVLEIVEEMKLEQSPTTENEAIETIQNNNEITYQTGTGSKGNGIEITFTSKPSEEVRNLIKSNGYRWGGKSRSSIWWAIMNDDTIAIAESLAGGKVEEIEAITDSVTYPEIEIDDNDTYTINQQLQDREHDANWVMRKNKIDHNQQIQEYFTQLTNEVKQIIQTTENEYFIYKLKKTLQYYKKHYFANYVSRLTNKADSPSWVTTGSAGRNRSRDQKYSNRYDKLMQEWIDLDNDYKSRINSLKNKIRKDKENTLKAQLQNELSQPLPELTFKTVTKEFDLYGNGSLIKSRFYEYEGYSIAKLWGAFRVYYNSKEIYSAKSAGTLQDAKAYVSLMIKQQQQAS